MAGMRAVVRWYYRAIRSIGNPADFREYNESLPVTVDRRQGVSVPFLIPFLLVLLL